MKALFDARRMLIDHHLWCKRRNRRFCDWRTLNTLRRVWWKRYRKVRTVAWTRSEVLANAEANTRRLGLQKVY